MMTIEMIKYGRILTDRAYGKQTAEELVKEVRFPVSLDFKGVMSLGSAFGDEVIHKISQKQNEKILVFNANGAVRSCLEKIAEDFQVSFEFDS